MFRIIIILVSVAVIPAAVVTFLIGKRLKKTAWKPFILIGLFFGLLVLAALLLSLFAFLLVFAVCSVGGVL